MQHIHSFIPVSFSGTRFACGTQTTPSCIQHQLHATVQDNDPRLSRRSLYDALSSPLPQVPSVSRRKLKPFFVRCWNPFTSIQLRNTEGDPSALSLVLNKPTRSTILSRADRPINARITTFLPCWHNTITAAESERTTSYIMGVGQPWAGHDPTTTMGSTAPFLRPCETVQYQPMIISNVQLNGTSPPFTHIVTPAITYQPHLAWNWNSRRLRTGQVRRSQTLFLAFHNYQLSRLANM